ncbi:MAG: hypothetical protein WCQ47_04085 [bacterium]
MKKLVIAFSSLVLFASCGGSGSSSDNVFYSTAYKVLPNINTTLIKSSSVSTNDTVTNTCNASPTGDVKTICDTFEAYTEDNWNNEDATIGHPVGMTNFYKFIIQTDSYISDGMGATATAVNGKVNLLYDNSSLFWESTDTYVSKSTKSESSQRFSAYAWDQPNNKYAVMYDHQDANDEALTYGSKTATVFDLAVKMWVGSPGSGSYRRFTGDATEQSFTMQDTGSSGSKLALAGFAQGTAKHFLAKSVNGATTNYYCFTINSEQTYTTTSGKAVTVITGLTYTEQPTCTSAASSCGGCEADHITVAGTLRALPDAVDYLVTDMSSVTVPTQHFGHVFNAE